MGDNMTTKKRREISKYGLVLAKIMNYDAVLNMKQMLHFALL